MLALKQFALRQSGRLGMRYDCQPSQKAVRNLMVAAANGPSAREQRDLRYLHQMRKTLVENCEQQLDGLDNPPLYPHTLFNRPVTGP